MSFLTEKSSRQPNYFVILIAAIAALGGFLFGFDSSIIADTKDQITAQFSLTDFQWSWIVSVSLLGSVIGIPISGLMADRISRKSMLILVAVGFIMGAILCAQATQLQPLIIGRFVIGICIGIASYISPLFIAEMAPASIRGGMILMNGLAITFGQAFSFLLGYFLHDISASSWRLLLWLGTLPAFCLLIGILFVPHSPRWIMAKQDFDKVYRVLKKIRRTEAEIQTEILEMKLNLMQPSSANRLTLFKKPFLFVLMVGLGLGIFQQFSGINSIMYYGPVVFETAGFYPIKTALLATFWMGLINFIFTAITLFFVDKLGRRFLLLSGTLLASISLVLVACYYQLQWFNQKWLMLCFMSTYIMGYCISVGSLFWVIISEIYPLKIRGLAMSIATVAQWGANFVVSISFLGIFHHFGEIKTFWLFSFICLCAFIFIYYFVPETTGVSLEKIEENLLAGKKLRELGQSFDNVIGEVESVTV
ncbi:MAG: sugar porter family MFS transporter [Gammaproteobacteria bacterium]|nr:MAG: sugar porter family MFS transporter [Gammaproteobacteria bacterium]